MPRAFLAAFLLALVPAARGADDKPYPLQVEVGKAVPICPTRTIQCPAGAPMCDDPKVAVPTSTPEGLAFEGVGPGRTLCSAGSAAGYGPRRVYEVTVTRHAPPGKQGKAK